MATTDLSLGRALALSLRSYFAPHAWRAQITCLMETLIAGEHTPHIRPSVMSRGVRRSNPAAVQGAASAPGPVLDPVHAMVGPACGHGPATSGSLHPRFVLCADRRWGGTYVSNSAATCMRCSCVNISGRASVRCVCASRWKRTVSLSRAIASQFSGSPSSAFVRESFASRLVVARPVEPVPKMRYDCLVSLSPPACSLRLTRSYRTQ